MDVRIPHRHRHAAHGGPTRRLRRHAGSGRRRHSWPGHVRPRAPRRGVRPSDRAMGRLGAWRRPPAKDPCQGASVGGGEGECKDARRRPAPESSGARRRDGWTARRRPRRQSSSAPPACSPSITASAWSIGQASHFVTPVRSSMSSPSARLASNSQACASPPTRFRGIAPRCRAPAAAPYSRGIASRRFGCRSGRARASSNGR